MTDAFAPKILQKTILSNVWDYYIKSKQTFHIGDITLWHGFRKIIRGCDSCVSDRNYFIANVKGTWPHPPTQSTLLIPY